MQKNEKKPMNESDVLRALYHMYCAAAYKGNVTMSSETAIGLYNFFNSQKAEIERLNRAVSYGKDLVERMTINQQNLINFCKAKAIEEFAERLIGKEVCFNTDDGQEECFVSVKDIRKQEKEMVGDAE